MIKLVINEWIKFKSTRTFYLGLAIAVMTPLIVAAVVLILSANTDHTKIQYQEYMTMNLRVMLRAISLCFYTYVAADVMAREYHYDTLKFQLSIPIPRGSLYMSKVLFISGLILIYNMILYLVAMISGLIMYSAFSQLTLEFLLVFVKASILTMPFAFFALSLATVLRNRFFPTAINVCMFLLSMVIIRYSFSYLVPWTIPSRIIFFGASSQMSHLGFGYLILFAFTVLSLYLGYHKITREEL